MAQPLTKRLKNEGAAYVRRPQIEAEIDELLQLEPAARLRRAGKGADPSMSDEALLHLVRDAHRRNSEAERNNLVRLLFTRCHDRLKRAMPDGRFPNAQVLRDECLMMFSTFLLEDGTGKNPDRLDYYEVNFAGAFKVLRSNVRRQQEREFKRAVQLPEDAEDDTEEPMRKDDVARRAEEMTACGPRQESALEAKLLAKRLEVLTPQERDAVILKEMGFKMDSKDPNEPTIARKCGVTGRTVQNWLDRAAKKLSAQEAQ